MRATTWRQVLGCVAVALAITAGGCGNDGLKVNARQNKLSPQDESLRDMIPHHQGAVDWARLVLERGERPELRELGAATLKGATEDIEAMERLLGPGKSANAHNHGGDHYGPAGIARIRAGAVTDKILLDWMNDHHQVGLDPGHAAVPKIDNPDIKVLVEGMNGRLDKGLEKMRAWRVTWYGA